MGSDLSRQITNSEIGTLEDTHITTKMVNSTSRQLGALADELKKCKYHNGENHPLCLEIEGLTMMVSYNLQRSLDKQREHIDSTNPNAK